MSDKKISQLTAGGAAQATDELPIARAGTNVKVTGADIAAAATSVGTLTGLTVNGTTTISGASFGLSGNISAAAWTTSGIRYRNLSGTLTDTSSSGTVATAYTNVYGGNTIAASNTTTFTDYLTTFIDNPVAGTNVTLTNRWALGLGGALRMTGQSLTGSQAQSLIDAVATWNTTGTPTAIKLNVTDTASNAASLLMDLQVGGVTRFNIKKDGQVTFVAGSKTAPSVLLSTSGGGFYGRASGFVSVSDGSTEIGLFHSTYLVARSSLGLSSGDISTTQADVFLTRDAGDTLAQRRTTNPQTFRIYSTFTDASNYERGYFTTDSNGLTIGTQALGTGTKRPVRIVGPSLASAEAVSTLDMSQTWNTTGTPTAIKLNVTDTASNAASLLMDLQTGGTSQLRVTKSGVIEFNADTSRQLYSPSAQRISINANGIVTFSNGGVLASSAGTIGFRNATGATADADVAVLREAADTLAQRRATNAQTFRWYRTFTDTSNYERGALQTASGQVIVAAETAGTGDDNIDVTLTPAGTGNVRFGTHSALAAETVTGYITIKDAGGTVRKLAVV